MTAFGCLRTPNQFTSVSETQNYWKTSPSRKHLFHKEGCIINPTLTSPRYDTIPPTKIHCTSSPTIPLIGDFSGSPNPPAFPGGFAPGPPHKIALNMRPPSFSDTKIVYTSRVFRPENSIHFRVFKAENSEHFRVFKSENSEHFGVFRPENSRHFRVFRPENSVHFRVFRSENSIHFRIFKPAK